MAFIESDILKIIEKGLSYIPADCEYRWVVHAVVDFHAKYPENWRDCFQYIYDNFGYDRYPGNCHIIPNIAVMVLALLYGKNDFNDTINICNMCGWDTDCNVGNVATIMGVLCGIDAIEDRWIKPVHDLVVCSSVIGDLNIMDVPFGASYIAMLAYRVAGEEIPGVFKDIIEKRIDSCHFEYPKSTHSLAVRGEAMGKGVSVLEVMLSNSDETAYTGERSLKMTVKPVNPAERVYLYKKTHYQPKDFHNSRYDPCFSPLLYPGQTIHGSAFIPSYSRPAYVRLYAKEQRTGEEFYGDRILLATGNWHEMSFTIPPMEGALLDEAGFLFEMSGEHGERAFDFVAFVDDLYFDGKADYSVEFKNETHEVWTPLHIEISQFTKVKGLMYLENGWLNLACADFAEAYTGRHDWKDYSAAFILSPVIGEVHYVNFRVQGAIRSYAFGFEGNGKLALLKNENGYRKLAEKSFDWKCGNEYTLAVSMKGNHIVASCGNATLEYTDVDHPYLNGMAGVSVHKGSHCRYKSIMIQ
jgi:hypothetical protein